MSLDEAVTLVSAVFMQHTWTVVLTRGPNHLGLWFNQDEQLAAVMGVAFDAVESRAVYAAMEVSG